MQSGMNFAIRTACHKNVPAEGSGNRSAFETGGTASLRIEKFCKGSVRRQKRRPYFQISKIRSRKSNLEKVMRKHGITNIDLIISGLPFLPKETKKKVFKAIKKQTDKGAKFRFFTYMPPIMKKVYKDLPVEKKSFVLKNVPPMWVYGIN